MLIYSPEALSHSTMAEDFSSVPIHWNISVMNSNFNINDENNGLAFYREAETYWMFMVNDNCHQ